MSPRIDSIEISRYRLPLDTPFHASWDPQPRSSHASTIVRVRAGEYEGVGSGDAIYSPHIWGDGLVLLANLHVAAALSRAPFIEFPYDPPNWTPECRDFILPNPIWPDDVGYITLPDKPSLEVDINWPAIEPWQVDLGLSRTIGD